MEKKYTLPLYKTNNSPGERKAGVIPFREKTLMLLICCAFLFIIFGTLYFLPDRVDDLGSAGGDFFIPMKKSLSTKYVVQRRNINFPRINRSTTKKTLNENDNNKNLNIDSEKLKNQKDVEANEMDVLLKKKSILKKSLEDMKPIINSAKIKSHVGDTALGPDPIDEDTRMKRNVVKKMMKSAWDMYVKYSWGLNELKPLSMTGHSAGIFGHSSFGASIVDALDTLYIMDLKEDFTKARDWVASSLDFDNGAGDISVFEMNIRFMGGLLAAYALSGDKVFKEKAEFLGHKLLPAFDSPTGIPYAMISIKGGSAHNAGWTSGCSILSEFGTLHLEFLYLSEITGNRVFADKVRKIRNVLATIARPDGFYYNYLNPQNAQWCQQHVSMGALGDSFYEYLIKSYVQSNRTDVQSRDMYFNAMETVENKLLQKSKGGLSYFAEMKYGSLEHKMDHLACFTGGMFGLGALESPDSEVKARHMNIAKEITHTCHESYDRTDTKLGPESFRFEGGDEAKGIRSGEQYYILRPEVIESYFYLWRYTHDQKYRDWGWEAIQALKRHCETPLGGFSGIRNVYSSSPEKDDTQQSFFLAETLKYLFLLFSEDSQVPLDRWVFNSEAHLLPVFTPIL